MDVLIVLIIIAIPFILMHLDQKKKGYITVVYFDHIQGIPDVGEGVRVLFFLYPDKITINELQTIPMSRIKGSELITNIQLENYNKSVIGRGIIGGLLAGGIGAGIGAVSGLQQGKRQQLKFLLIINYVNKNGVEKNAVFSTKDKKSAMKISDYINEKTGYVAENKLESYEV